MALRDFSDVTTRRLPHCSPCWSGNSIAGILTYPSCNRWSMNIVSPSGNSWSKNSSICYQCLCDSMQEFTTFWGFGIIFILFFHWIWWCDGQTNRPVVPPSRPGYVLCSCVVWDGSPKMQVKLWPTNDQKLQFGCQQTFISANCAVIGVCKLFSIPHSLYNMQTTQLSKDQTMALTQMLIKIKLFRTICSLWAISVHLMMVTYNDKIMIKMIITVINK